MLPKVPIIILSMHDGPRKIRAAQRSRSRGIRDKRLCRAYLARCYGRCSARRDILRTARDGKYQNSLIILSQSATPKELLRLVPLVGLSCFTVLGATALWVLPCNQLAASLKEFLGFLVMASWALTCTKCNSKIIHSQIVQKNLSELFFPPKPDIPAGATIACPKCGTVVSYVTTDLRYVSD